jgi:peroxiredoxin Q/BCP
MVPDTETMMGKEAPQFCLPDSDGTEVCLTNYRGNWVILYFYPRDNTPGCTLEAIQFNKEVDTFKESGAVIIGISPDTRESHQKFQEKHELQFLLLSDTDHRVLVSYGVWKPKVLFGKELLGVERSTFLIDPQGKIVEIWRKVHVPGHAAAVLTVLNRHRKEGMMQG